MRRPENDSRSYRWAASRRPPATLEASTSLLFLAALSLVALPASGAQTADADAAVQSFGVSQVSQIASIPPTLEVHLALLDADELQIRESEAPPILEGSLGGEPIQTSALEPLSAEEGVAYVVLVDVSASLSPATFRLLQQALLRWIESFSPEDRLAVVTFGETSRVLVDFTRDFDTAQAPISALAPRDRLTVLHRGLLTALDLAKRSDTDLPDRRAIVVLTDGQDEGSGLTVEDVLHRLETGSRFPIYAIGLSSLEGAERRRYLDVLLRLATASGGAYFEAGTTDLEQAYRRIGRLIRDVWVGRVECPRCRTDGSERYLELRLHAGSRVLSRGVTTRLLPGLGTAAYPVSADAADRADSADAVPEPVGTGPAENRPSLLLLLLALASGGLVVLALSIVARRRKSRRRLAIHQDDPASIPLPAPDPAIAAHSPRKRSLPRGEHPLDGASTVTAVPHAEPRRLRFDVVRGDTKGAERRLLLSGSLKVGRRSTCDLVLSQETNLAPEQLVLVQNGYRVLLEDLSGGSTLINGRPPSDPQPIQSGDLVGNRDVILRIVFEG